MTYRSFFFISGLLFLGLFFVFSFLYFSYKKEEVVPPEPLTADILLNGRPSYVEAERLAEAGNFEQANALYSMVLAEHLTPAEEGVVKLKVALSLAYDEENYLQALDLLIEIANNTSYTDPTRASSIQEMANLYSRYKDENITEKIFSAEPFKNLIRIGDSEDVLYRRLYEYAASIYPLALSELQIARWHAAKLERIKNDSTPTEAELAYYPISLEIIRARAKEADRYIEFIRKTPTSAFFSTLDTILNHKALLAVRLLAVGEKDILGDPEQYFKEALSSNPDILQEGYIRYNYATFLAYNFGAERSEDIQKLLQPIYESDQFEKLALLESFEELKEISKEDVSSSGRKHRAVRLLADIDPKFKSFLEEQGWDF